MAMHNLHPVVTELNLEKDPLAAVFTLNYLIEKGKVTAEDIRSAHRSSWPSAHSRSSGGDYRDPPVNGKGSIASETADELQNLKRPVDTTGAKALDETTSANRSSTKSKDDPIDIPTTLPIRRRHIAIRFYYDGGAYTGLAQNVGVDSDKSIERQLFAALQKAHLVTSREESHYSRCGRTDRGVSSAGQVVALHLKSAFVPNAVVRTDDGTLRPLTDDDLPKNSHDKIKVWVPPKKKKKTNVNNDKHQQNEGMEEKEMSEYPYEKILNNLLPPDIRILGWSPVSNDFSARFSATTRTYRYFFVPRTMNLENMRQALQLMVGTHDFRNLCRMDVEKVYNFERQIHSAEIVLEDTYGDKNCRVAYILIVGQAFLWHQIRCIASILFLIGRGLEEPSVVRELLDVESNPGKPSYPLADERPLVLHDCQYNNLHIGYSVSNFWNIVRLQEQQWEESALAAARIRNSIDSLQELPVRTADLMDFYSSKQKQRLKRREGNKKTATSANSSDQEENTVVSFPVDTITWKQALVWLEERGRIPDPDVTTDFVYTPLMQRSKGTTYEEKVASIQNSTKRRQRFEENVVKKRKSKEEDAAFYTHMTQQGGSAR